MAVGKATLQRLEVLQSGRPLEAPPACLAAVAGLPDVPPKDLFDSVDQADAAQLRELLRRAQFWISLLEGERCDAAEEVARHKRRYQQALRQADAKTTELKEVEGEKKRLLSEIKWLQQSRDQAICERHLLREDKSRISTQSQGDKESAAQRAETLEAELKVTREEKARFEAELVRVKVRAAETAQRVDSMEYLVEYYEDQLRALNPAFEPATLEAIGQWMKPAGLDGCDGESVWSGNKDEAAAQEEKPKAQKVSKGLSKMFKGVSKLTGHKKKHKDNEAQDHDDSLVTPRDVSSTPRIPSSSPRPSPRDEEVLAAPAGPPAKAPAAAEAAATRPSIASPERSEESSPASRAPSSQVSPSPLKAKRRWELRVED